MQAAGPAVEPGDGRSRVRPGTEDCSRAANSLLDVLSR
jgi:hypothetical protein